MYTKSIEKNWSIVSQCRNNAAALVHLAYNSNQLSNELSRISLIRRDRQDQLLDGQGDVVGVVGNPGWLVGPGDEDPVDRKCCQDHGHPDGGLHRLGNHRQDRDGRRQDDVNDREEEVDLRSKEVRVVTRWGFLCLKFLTAFHSTVFGVTKAFVL